MSDEKEPCPGCGQAHDDDPFTPEMWHLLGEIQSEEDPNEKEAKMIALATCFIEETSPSDLDITDEMHGFMDKVEETRLAYQASVLLVARIIARQMTATQYQERFQKKRVPEVPKPTPGPKKTEVN